MNEVGGVETQRDGGNRATIEVWSSRVVLNRCTWTAEPSRTDGEILSIVDGRLVSPFSRMDGEILVD